MRYYLTIIISLSLSAAACADTIKATVNGMVCGFCATGIEKTFKAQPEVKTVTVDLQKRLVTERLAIEPSPKKAPRRLQHKP